MILNFFKGFFSNGKDKYFLLLSIIMTTFVVYYSISIKHTINEGPFSISPESNYILIRKNNNRVFEEITKQNNFNYGDTVYIPNQVRAKLTGDGIDSNLTGLLMFSIRKHKGKASINYVFTNSTENKEYIETEKNKISKLFKSKQHHSYLKSHITKENFTTQSKFSSNLIEINSSNPIVKVNLTKSCDCFIKTKTNQIATESNTDIELSTELGPNLITLKSKNNLILDNLNIIRSFHPSSRIFPSSSFSISQNEKIQTPSENLVLTVNNEPASNLHSLRFGLNHVSITRNDFWPPVVEQYRITKKLPTAKLTTTSKNIYDYKKFTYIEILKENIDSNFTINHSLNNKTIENLNPSTTQIKLSAYGTHCFKAVPIKNKELYDTDNGTCVNFIFKELDTKKLNKLFLTFSKKQNLYFTSLPVKGCQGVAFELYDILDKHLEQPIEKGSVFGNNVILRKSENTKNILKFSCNNLTYYYKLYHNVDPFEDLYD